MSEPLANKLRPTSIKDIVGQKHILNNKSLLMKMISVKKPQSLILFGSPGIGKTTMANIIAKQFDKPIAEFNAANDTKKELDEIFKKAKFENGVIVIIDEIHRLNKDKQDLLLPHVERGSIIIIGLTTSNPLFSINPAIRSRCLMFELKAPSHEEMLEALENLCEKCNMTSLSDNIKRRIVQMSDGDVRQMINILQALSNFGDEIEEELLDTLICNRSSIGDEDSLYDLMSAYQKSIRGSDVDAALYYLAQLIEIGDFKTIERRLLVTAYEDIGLANPQVVTEVAIAIDSAMKVGYPECSFALSFATIRLCLEKKSKSAHDAINYARQMVQSDIHQMPEFLKLKPALPSSKKYDYKDYKNWSKINYKPEFLTNNNIKIYIPSNRDDSTMLENYKSINERSRTYAIDTLK